MSRMFNREDLRNSAEDAFASLMLSTAPLFVLSGALAMCL